MRILFIGAVTFSKMCLLKLRSMDQDIVGIISSPDTGINSDYSDLKSSADAEKIPYHETVNVNSTETIDWAKNLKADVIFCFGWSRLLKTEILNLTPMGVVGYHPAMLPKNKGRHPIIWALVLGLNETGSTFFFMDEGADTGDIISQQVIPILSTDTALSLYNRMTEAALSQMEEWIIRMNNGNHQRIVQDTSAGNSWRKRGIPDGQIDWRMSSKSIYNLVRALSKPYPGAHFMFDNIEYKVWACRVENENSINIEPGKVLKKEANNIWVKTGDGIIVLTEHEAPSSTLPAYL
jgi:methionyl-tRNA formyltransferase